MAVSGLPLVGIEVDGLGSGHGCLGDVDDAVVPVVASRSVWPEVHGVPSCVLDLVVVDAVSRVPESVVAPDLELLACRHVERDHVLTLSLGVGGHLVLLCDGPLVHRANQVVLGVVEDVCLAVLELEVVGRPDERGVNRTLAVAEPDLLGCLLSLEGEGVESVVHLKQRSGCLVACHGLAPVEGDGCKVGVVVECLLLSVPHDGVDLLPSLVGRECDREVLPVPLPWRELSVGLEVGGLLLAVPVWQSHGGDPVEVDVVGERDVLGALVGPVVGSLSLLPGILANGSGLDESCEDDAGASFGKRGLVDGELSLDVVERDPLSLVVSAPRPYGEVAVSGLPLVGIEVDGLTLCEAAGKERQQQR